MNYLKNISQNGGPVQVVFYDKLRDLCLNYLKKISQMWWSSVGSILQCSLCLNYLKTLNQHFRNSKQMPSDVAEVLQEIFITEGKLTKEEAEDYLKQMIRTRRYQRETWAWR